MNPGDFGLTPAKQKLFILGINPSLGPLSTLNVDPSSELEVVPWYKYLGVWLDEYLDYQNCVNALNESARKALSLLIAKSKQFGNFPFEAFSSLYDSLVIPRIDYGAGVWGYRTFPKLQTIQNKAIIHILCVGKNCPVGLLEGDSGWVPVWCRL